MFSMIHTFNTDELLCNINAGAWVSMVSYLKKSNINIEKGKNVGGH
jgi:hypothetical protein